MQISKGSPAEQRYTAEIYRLEEHGEYVSISDLGASLDVTMQAATRMVKRLQEKDYLVHEPYKGVHLTDAGRAVAMIGLRRHRLAERFLVEKMGFGWHEVHDLTDTFELGVAPLIEERIDELLGYPTRCPHGEPIPDRGGVMPAVNDLPLIDFSEGSTVRISRVRLHDPEKLLYLGKLGLVPGAEITFLTCAPFEGPLRVMIGATDQVISYKLASCLWVEAV